MIHGNKPPFSCCNRNAHAGFSLVEIIVGAAVFLIVAVSVYDGYFTISKATEAARYKVTGAALADEEIEIIRNMPYSEVGVAGSIPTGVLAHTQTLSRDGNNFLVTTTVRNIDDPFDGTLGGTPNDTAPADYKLVEVDIDCASCKNFTPLTFATRVAPKNLETASTNGALFIKAFDGNGLPIQDANVHVVNASSSLTIDDVTDATGQLALVDVPPGGNAYAITVTKPGYTTEKTYPPGAAGNPNPLHSNATVLLQQVTQTSFSIDKFSTMNISSVTPTCTPVGGIGFSYTGSKLIGTNPNVIKNIMNASTNSSGSYTDNSVEWDTYNFAMTNSAYQLLGMNPVNPVTIAPGAIQNVQMIVHGKTPQTVLVTVLDAGTKLPITDATVEMTDGGSFDQIQQTGRGYLRQTDWSGGAGQQDFADATKYSSSDGNIETALPVGDLRLSYRLGQYENSGSLTSSSFDVGSSTNFNEVIFNPTNEPMAAGTDSVKFQIATNNDDATWNFVGPDGSSSTYFTAANRNISAANNNTRFFRYKAFLSTASTSTTPNLAEFAFTFTGACTPPGQVVFEGLSSGPYTVVVTKTGYQQFSTNITVGSTWSAVTATLTP